MNIRDLQYICAVTEHKHFGKAARAVRVSQPTLSGQIKKFEENLGVSLFERSKRFVSLTPAGKDVYRLAREILTLVDSMEHVTAEYRDPLFGEIKLGVIPTIAPYLVPSFFANLKKSLPALEPKLIEKQTEDLITELREGNIDAALLATDVEDNRLQSIALYSESFLLATPPNYFPKVKATISISEIQLSDLLLLEDGHCLRDQALSLCKLNDSAYNSGMRASSLETLLNLVRAGYGITLIPATAVSFNLSNDSQLELHSITESSAERAIVLTYRKGFPREGLLKRIAEIIKQSTVNFDSVTIASEN